MEIINVESLIWAAIEKGLTGDSIVHSVQSRIGQLRKEGVRLDWSGFKPTNPFWYEGYDRDEKGRKLSRGQIRGAMTTYRIEFLISKVWNEIESVSDLPSVFSFEETDELGETGTLLPSDLENQDQDGDVRSPRNATAKDGSGILFATNPNEIRRHDVNRLLLELTPVLKHVASSVIARFRLPASYKDDLVQEARERIWRSLPSYRGEGWFKSWAAVVARHAMWDFAEREVKHVWHRPADDLESVDAHHPDIDEVLDLVVALRQVPDGRLLVQRDVIGYSERELAAMEGYPEGSRAISMRLNRARVDVTMLAA